MGRRRAWERRGAARRAARPAAAYLRVGSSDGGVLHGLVRDAQLGELRDDRLHRAAR
jgi:hypothetical protein